MCLLDLSLYEPNNQVIAAEGEQKASRALREAADVISESPAALQVWEIILKQRDPSRSMYIIWLVFQLRYLQTLGSISAEHNSTIIFPMPINIIDHFMTKKRDM